MLLMGREKTQFFIGFSNKAFSSYLCWKIEKLAEWGWREENTDKSIDIQTYSKCHSKHSNTTPDIQFDFKQ